MNEDTLRYRGKPIDAMTIDELRAALVECVRYAQATAQAHQAHITMLRTLIHRDDDQQQRLFMEFAK